MVQVAGSWLEENKFKVLSRMTKGDRLGARMPAVTSLCEGIGCGCDINLGNGTRVTDIELALKEVI